MTMRRWKPAAIGYGRFHSGMSVKEGSWPLLAAHFPDLATLPVVRSRGRRQRYFRPPRLATTPQRVRCLIFPLYQPGAELDLLALRPGEALALCARSGGWYESSRERLEEFTRWLVQTPAYAHELRRRRCRRKPPFSVCWQPERRDQHAALQPGCAS